MNAGLAVKSGHQKADLGWAAWAAASAIDDSLLKPRRRFEEMRHTHTDASIDSRVRLCPHRIFLTVLLLINPQSTQELLGGRQLGQPSGVV